MGNDINSLVSNYLKNNSNADIESVKQAFENLTMNSRDTSLSSIFDLDGFSGSMSEEEFLNLMSTATNKSADSIKDDVSILFDILDSEADGVGSLSKNELSQLASSSNTNSISSFSIWNKFLLFSEDEIAKSGSSGTKVDDSDNTVGDDGDSKIEDGETPGTTTPDTNEPESKKAFDINDPESVKSYLDDFIDKDHKTYESVIKYLQDSGIISEDMASQLTDAITKTSLTPAEQARVDAAIAMNPDLTEEEAIEKLGLGKSPDTSELTQSQYKEIDAEQWADDLFEAMDGRGTDEKALESLLTDSTISEEDFAKIVEAYDKKYGQGAGNVGLVTRIEQETSGDLQKKLTGVLGMRLLTAAENGDETAIDMLCKEIYSGTAGQTNTANDFLDSVFSTDNEELLYKINKRYSEINKGRDLVTDIKNDHLGILGWRGLSKHIDASGNGQSYIDKITNAVRHHRE